MLSTYIKIFGFKPVPNDDCGKKTERTCAAVIDELADDISNCLGVIRYGIELLPVDEGSKHQLRCILSSVEGVQKLLCEGKEYLGAARELGHFRPTNPVAD